MKRLIDGAWKHAEGGLKLGYSKRLWDVEHSAEPSSDTQPLMLLFEPDNSLYVGRNLKLLPLTRDLWTTKGPNGFRYFKSAYMSALTIDDSLERRAHIPYHTRAVQGMTWLAWHGTYPESDKTWLELADSWSEATYREAQGKISGSVPAAVDYATGKLGTPRAGWYKPELNWSYYNWGRAGHTQVFGFLCSAFLKTGDTNYMTPIFTALNQAKKFKLDTDHIPQPPLTNENETPSEDYQRYLLSTWYKQGLFVPYLLAYRNASGDTSDDSDLEHIAQFPECDPVVRYQITGNVDHLIEQYEANFE